MVYRFAISSTSEGFLQNSQLRVWLPAQHANAPAASPRGLPGRHVPPGERTGQQRRVDFKKRDYCYFDNYCQSMTYFYSLPSLILKLLLSIILRTTRIDILKWHKQIFLGNDNWKFLINIILSDNCFWPLDHDHPLQLHTERHSYYCPHCKSRSSPLPLVFVKINCLKCAIRLAEQNP
jgi:hypothetical protein